MAETENKALDTQNALPAIKEYIDKKAGGAQLWVAGSSGTKSIQANNSSRISATGDYSVAEGIGTKALGQASHAEGTGTRAEGMQSHAEGSGTQAEGQASHAEGSITIAAGIGSHAEGTGTRAGAQASHVEGYNTIAAGIGSHAEGYGTTASGPYSHAEGYCTYASSDYQHASGKYNVEDGDDTYAVIVGNGSYNKRSNAYTLDWGGNGVFAGKVTAGADPTVDMDLATKKYVDNHSASVEAMTDGEVNECIDMFK